MTEEESYDRCKEGNFNFQDHDGSSHKRSLSMLSKMNFKFSKVRVGFPLAT